MSGRHRRGVRRAAARPARRPVGKARARRRQQKVLVAVPIVALLGLSAYAAPGVAGVCLYKGEPLRVQADPAIAPALRAVAHRIDPSDTGCRQVSVTAAAPGTVARHAISDSADLPDVWVPDSSAWPYLVRQSGAGSAADAIPASGPSLATSPVVLAVSTTTADALGWPKRPLQWSDVFGAVGSRGLRLALPDPRRYAPAAASLIGQSTATGPGAGTAPLSAALRNVDPNQPGEPDQLLEWVTSTPSTPLAAPVPEQEVWAHNAHSRHLELVAAYGGATAPSVDYPYLVLTHDDELRTVADTLLARLRGVPAVQRLQAAGFRTSNGFAGPALSPGLGVRPDRAMVTAAQPAAVTAAIRAMDRARRDSRVLAVLDVSGSMATRLPDGSTRMDVARQSAAAALGTLSDHSEVGLWAFSTNLQGPLGYRPLVETGSLISSIGMTPRRQALNLALAHLAPKIGGGTALYDTVLAAVRNARQGWSDQAQNVVVLFTDGRNDVPGGMSLQTLLATLHREADPRRPVPVVTIALGADSDVASLHAIASTTGGAAYVAQTPLQARQAFLDAIARQP